MKVIWLGNIKTGRYIKYLLANILIKFCNGLINLIQKILKKSFWKKNAFLLHFFYMNLPIKVIIAFEIHIYENLSIFYSIIYYALKLYSDSKQNLFDTTMVFFIHKHKICWHIYASRTKKFYWISLFSIKTKDFP